MTRIFALFWLVPLVAHADDVHLRNGQTLKNCQVIDTTDSRLHIHTTQKERILPLTSIEEIVLAPFDSTQPTVVVNLGGSVHPAISEETVKSELGKVKEMPKSQQASQEDSLVNNAFGIDIVGGITLNAGGFTAGTNIFVLNNHSMYSMRFLYSGRATNGTSDPVYHTSGNPGNPFIDASLLYGFGRMSTSLLYSVSAGVGYVQGIENWTVVGYDSANGFFDALFGDFPGPIYAPKNFSTIGLAFDFQVVWTYSEYYNVGAYLWGNLNQKRSFVGLTLCYQFSIAW